jgi:hypothetical protein
MHERALWRCLSESPWFLYSERDQKALADHRPRVLYKERRRNPTKPLGKVHNSSILHI